MVEQQYGVRPKVLVGGAKDVKEVNDWVSQQTGRKVQQFLAKPFPRAAGVNAVSASYFKGTSQSFLKLTHSSTTMIYFLIQSIYFRPAAPDPHVSILSLHGV